MGNFDFSHLGIRVFGIAAIALGLIGIIWGDFAAVWQPVPADFEYRTPLAYAMAALLLIGGSLVLIKRNALGIAILIALYFVSALMWLPRVVAFPEKVGGWAGFAELFSLTTAAGVLYASAQSSRSRLKSIAHMLFALCVLLFGAAHFSAVKETAAMVPTWLPPNQRFWAIATGVGDILAGIAIIIGVQAKLATRLLTVMFASFSIFVWLPMLLDKPTDHFVWVGNAITFAMMSAAWVVADSFSTRSGR